MCIRKCNNYLLNLICCEDLFPRNLQCLFNRYILFCFDIISSLSRDHLLANLNFHPSFLYFTLMGICVTTISCVKYTLHAQSIFSAITIMQLSLKGNCVKFRPLFILKNTNILPNIFRYKVLSQKRF